MASVTYFVALPFLPTEAGELVAGEARECQSSGAAERAARSMVRGEVVGAVAFSRVGDPAIGEFADAEIIARFGEVPRDLEALTGT